MPAPERVRPGTDEACAALLAACGADRRTVRVRGGGTKDGLGVLLPTDVVLETGALAGIVDHVPADLTVTVRAGTPLADLQAALAAAGQFLPLDPPHVARGATVGGIVAANSNGFARYRYGGVRDLLIGLRAALPDGALVRSGGRVVKNVAGYDLNKLFTGSLGALGVIVEATFKVLPVPPVARSARAAFRTPRDAFAVADALLRTSVRPTALVVDRGDDRAWAVTVAAAGEAPPVERALRELTRLAAERGVTAEACADDAGIAAAREIADAATDGALVRAALPLSAQPPFAAAAAAGDATARIVADAANGIVFVWVRGDEDAVVTAADGLIADAQVLGGGARVERTATARLSTFGEREPAGAFLMKRIKDAFDPAGVLEPARSAVG